jgi:hypothetical protein
MRFRQMACVICSVLAKSSPGWSRTGHRPKVGPATYQIAMLPLQHRTVGKVGVEPTASCSQGTRGTVPLHPVSFDASCQQLVWESNPSLRLERPVSLTDRRTSHLLCFATHARTPIAVGREALESSSPGFQPSAMPSQLPTQFGCGTLPGRKLCTGQQKKPDVLVTPSFGSQSDHFRSSVTSAKDAAGYFVGA